VLDKVVQFVDRSCPENPMFDQLLGTFAQSKQGQAAYKQLQSQGYSPQQSANILMTALPAAGNAMQSAMTNSGGAQPLGLMNITDGHYATNFLAAAVTGFMKGDGLKGAAFDGIQGVVGGHVAEVIASRCGMPQRIAGVVGACVTPFLVDFLWEKFQGSGLLGGNAQQGTGAIGAGQPAQNTPFVSTFINPFTGR